MTTREFTIAAGLWAVAICTLIFGIEDSIQEGHNSIALGVAIFLAVAALAPTVGAICTHAMDRRETSVERIIEVVDALHEGRRDVRRMH